MQELRPAGISSVVDVPWGTHFCHFYGGRDDLADTMVPFFKAGLENNEYCLWVVSEPLSAAEAKKALADPEMQKKLAEQGIVAVGSTPDEFRAFVTEEVARWAKVIKDANIKTGE